MGQQEARTAAAFTSAVDLLASITNATDLYTIRAKVHALLGQLIEEMYCSLWQPSNAVQLHLLQMMPEQLQDLFVYGPIILVRVKLTEEVHQLTARILLINPATGQVASFIEQVPEGIQQQVVTDSQSSRPHGYQRTLQDCHGNNNSPICQMRSRNL